MNTEEQLADFERRIAALEAKPADAPVGSVRWIEAVETLMRQHLTKLLGALLLAWPAIQIVAKSWVNELQLSEDARHAVTIGLALVTALSTRIRRPE